MSTVLASDVIGRASILLQDSKNTRWSKAEMLAWLTDGQRAAALLNPRLFVRTAPLQLVAGTRQSLPADGKTLVNVPRNVDGNAVTPIAARTLDAQVPDWHSPARASKRVLHFAHDPDDPKSFLIYPPSPGGNAVVLVYNAIPPAAAIDAAIALDDSYVGALVDYLMYRAYLKDSEYAPTADKAALHQSSFAAQVKA